MSYNSAFKEHKSWSGVDQDGNASEFEMIHPSARSMVQKRTCLPKANNNARRIFERSMAGSDPVSVSQLVSSNANVNKGNRQRNAC
jgi:hypothetical protein